MNSKKSLKKFVMCAGKRCCPVITENNDGNYTITDDFGGSVLLEPEQLKLLKSFLNEIIKENS